MSTKDFIVFLIKVITSWQTVAVTVVLVIYFSLVSYVARLHHPRRRSFNFRRKKEKVPKVDEAMPESSDDDDLDLEE